MKSITFTVQLQADLPQGSQNRNAAALKLCQDINEILAKYDGITGGAQILPAPRNIRITTTQND